jgi:integrase
LKITRAILNPECCSEVTAALTRIHLRYGLLWNLGITTGLRITDLLSLRVSQVHKKNSLTVTEQKTGNERKVQIQDNVNFDIGFLVLHYHLSDNDFVFYSHENRKQQPMSRQWAHRLIHRIGISMGLENIGAHSMRKIYACNLFSSCGSLNAVQADLGHKYESTTLIYLKDLLHTNRNQ